MANRKYLDRLTLYVSILCSLTLLATAIWAWRAGAFRSMGALRAFIGQAGLWAPLALILMHVIQVVIPFIPGGLTLTAGVLLFGPYWGFVYNYAGILLGSLTAFLLAKRCGRPLVRWLAPAHLCEKYLDRPLPRRFEQIFALAILLPLAPDDTLCMIAGLTPMRTGRFLLILASMKPFSIALYSLSLLLCGHIWGF
ncbi:MAG: TVP38/TMEM64 family protein [Clostridiaceae bacterium]|nr:TVP38/TMEM64 family protein [Clostridiaceae bacterium]